MTVMVVEMVIEMMVEVVVVFGIEFGTEFEMDIVGIVEELVVVVVFGLGIAYMVAVEEVEIAVYDKELVHYMSKASFLHYSYDSLGDLVDNYNYSTVSSLDLDHSYKHNYHSYLYTLVYSWPWIEEKILHSSLFFLSP